MKDVKFWGMKQDSVPGVPAIRVKVFQEMFFSIPSHSKATLTKILIFSLYR